MPSNMPIATDGLGEMLVTADRSAAQAIRSNPANASTLSFAPESLLVFPT